MKKVRTFNRTGYDEAVRLALGKKDFAKKLSVAISVFKSDNIEEINKSLEEQTGFRNHEMSARLMNLQDEYQTIQEHLGKIDLHQYDSEFKDLEESTRANLKEQFTTNWSKEEAMLIDKVERLVKGLNDMGYAVKKSLMVNQYGEVRFDENQFNYHYQLNKINNTSLGKV